MTGAGTNTEDKAQHEGESREMIGLFLDGNFVEKTKDLTRARRWENKSSKHEIHIVHKCFRYPGEEQEEDQDLSSQDIASREMDRMIENMEREISRLETDYTGEYRRGRTGITEIREED